MERIFGYVSVATVATVAAVAGRWLLSAGLWVPSGLTLAMVPAAFAGVTLAVVAGTPHRPDMSVVRTRLRVVGGGCLATTAIVTPKTLTLSAGSTWWWFALLVVVANACFGALSLTVAALVSSCSAALASPAELAVVSPRSRRRGP